MCHQLLRRSVSHPLSNSPSLPRTCLAVRARNPQTRRGWVEEAPPGMVHPEAGGDEKHQHLEEGPAPGHGFKSGGTMTEIMKALTLTEEHDGGLWFNWVNSDDSSVMNRLGRTE